MDYMFANQECSSGCESGWTLYLEHSSTSPEASYDQENGRVFDKTKRLKVKEEEEEEEEEEDLSMVSDASSGPPHLHEEEGYFTNDNNRCYYPYTIDDSSSRNNPNRKKNRESRRCSRSKAQDQSSLLDDTASSPIFDFSGKSFTLARNQPRVENVLEYSQGYSTTHLEVRPPYQQHYDFFQHSQSGNQLQQQNQW